MAPKAGHKGYLQLGDSFKEPRWRQALVLRVEGDWLTTLVKCSEEEIVATNLTSVRHEGSCFCLVEAKMDNMRIGAPVPPMELEEDGKILLTLGTSALESDEDMVFGTASDPAQPKPKPPRKRIESSGSSESGSAGDAGMVEELRKAWLGTGSGVEKTKGEKTEEFQGSGRTKSKRFALIEKKSHHLSSSSRDKKAQQTVLAAAVKSGDPLHGLLALQLAESMKRGRNRHRKCSRSGSSSSDDSKSSRSSSDSSRDSMKGEKGHARAVHNYRKAGKRKFRRPLRHVRRFVKSIEEDLGAQDKPFRITDLNRKIHFGKQQNLKRCHYLCSTILEYLLKEEPHKAALQTVLALQAMHQAAIDGSWEVAWLLTHQEDPFRQRIFGGDPASLQHVTSYLRSMNDLAKNTESLRRKGAGKGQDEEQVGKDQNSKSRGKGQKGNKEKEKDKGNNDA